MVTDRAERHTGAGDERARARRPVERAQQPGAGGPDEPIEAVVGLAVDLGQRTGDGVVDGVAPRQVPADPGRGAVCGNEIQLGIVIEHARRQVVAVDPQLAVAEPLSVSSEVAQDGRPAVGRQPGCARDDVGAEHTFAAPPVRGERMRPHPLEQLRRLLGSARPSEDARQRALRRALTEVGTNSLVSQAPHVIDLVGEGVSRTIRREREPVRDPPRAPAVLQHGASHRVLGEHGLERLAMRGSERSAGGVTRSHDVIERSHCLDARRHDEATPRQQVGRDPPRPHVSPPSETIARTWVMLSGSSE